MLAIAFSGPCEEVTVSIGFELKSYISGISAT